MKKTNMKKPIFYWHIHHEVLLEPLTEPLKNRIDYIKENKPEEEQVLRLKIIEIKKVEGKLPIKLYKAWDTYSKAKFVKERKDYIKVILSSPSILKLHKKECGCKFKTSIFDNI